MTEHNRKSREKEKSRSTMHIKVFVEAGAKHEKVEEIGEHKYAIKVKEKSLENQANKRIREIIAGMYAVNTQAVRIINGHHRPNKLISIIS